ncbi:putative immunity protein [Fusibacter bizertensis]
MFDDVAIKIKKKNQILNDKVDIALVHAIGQGCSTVHVKNHAMGIVFYTLTAIVIEQHYVAYASVVLNQIDAYKCRMAYWKENGALKATTEKWASFLMR